MKASIILPTFNRAHILPKAINSVLNQSFKDFELLIIDDGSTDGTEEIVKGFNDKRIKYFKNKENLGIQKSLNIGLKMAQGKYIARIDDDVEWVDKDKLKRQVEFLDNNPDYFLVGTQAILERKKVVIHTNFPETDAAIREKLLFKNCFFHPSVVFLKEAALKVGGYDETPASCHVEDYDLWLKIGTIGKFYNFSTFSVKTTFLETQISVRYLREQLKKNIYLIKKYRRFYPHYSKALIYNLAKLVFFGYFNFLDFYLKTKKIVCSAK